MATGIQTGMRTGSRTPPLTRAQVAARWVRVRGPKLAFFLFLGLVAVAGVMWVLDRTGDPLERALRRPLAQALRGTRYRVTVHARPPGPVLTRRSARDIIIAVYPGEPERLAEARQVVEAVLDPARDDRVHVVPARTAPLDVLELLTVATSLCLGLSLVALAHRLQVFPRLRRRVQSLAQRWRERRRRPPAPDALPAAPLLGDERLRLEVPPDTDLRSLKAQIERVRQQLLQELGFRLPPVLLRCRPSGQPTCWQLWLRDRLVEEFQPGFPPPGGRRGVEARLARTLKESAWELVGLQDVQDMITAGAEGQVLDGSMTLLELTVVVRSLLQRGLKLPPLHWLKLSVGVQRGRNPAASLDTLVEGVVRDMRGLAR